jgi:hypothetical protein
VPESFWPATQRKRALERACEHQAGVGAKIQAA